jgi:hypothetical protein
VARPAEVRSAESLQPLTYSMRTRLPGRLLREAALAPGEIAAKSVGSGCRAESSLKLCCGLAADWQVRGIGASARALTKCQALPANVKVLMASNMRQAKAVCCWAAKAQRLGREHSGIRLTDSCAQQ